MPVENVKCKFAEVGGFLLKTADDQWTFTGTASTPKLDRQKDTVDPMGARFTLPLPILLQHDMTQPVGQIVSATVDKTGIRVEGKITEPDASMPMGLASRLREAWSSIKTGLIRGLSIGFIPLDYAFNDAGGLEIKTWDWLELSLVTVPAQPDASVSSFKSITPPIVRAHGGFPLRSPIIRLRS